MAANNIADENIVPVGFQNGLWFNDTTDQNPPSDGFCETLTNFYPDAAGTLKFRPSAVNSGITWSTGLEYPPTAIASGNFSSNAPARNITVDRFGAGGNRVYVHAHIGSGNTSSFGNLGGFTEITGFVEANSYIYVCGITGGSSVERIDSIASWNPVVFNRTVIAGSPTALDGMLYFKSRLFGWKNSTIYWTDAISNASPNPETWNTSTNSVILGSSGNRPKIWNILSFNDRLFIFTDYGIHVLIVQGAATSWILKPYDLSIKVNHKDCVVTYKGVIYCAATDGVYAFNGANLPKLISRPIQFWFRFTPNFVSPKIYLAGEFLLLSIATYQPDGTTKVSSINYGMDLTNPGPWFSMNFHGTSLSYHNIMGVVKAVPYSTTGIYDHLVIAGYNGAYSSETIKLCAWVPETTSDTLDGSSTAMIGIVKTIPSPLGSPIKLSHIKYAYLDFVTVPSSFTCTHYLEGASNVSASLGSVTAGVSVVKVQVDVVTRTISTYILVTATDGLYCRLKTIYYVVGTERNLTEQVTY